MKRIYYGRFVALDVVQFANRATMGDISVRHLYEGSSTTVETRTKFWGLIEFDENIGFFSNSRWVEDLLKKMEKGVPNVFLSSTGAGPGIATVPPATVAGAAIVGPEAGIG